MRIQQLTAYHVRIPLKKTIRHASHTRTSTDSLVVRCRLSDGTHGWGEGLPRSYVTGETIEAALDVLVNTNLRPSFSGPLPDLSAAVQSVDQMELAAPDPDGRGCFGHSVRCALELSILDATARAQNLPLAYVTQLLPAADSIRGESDRVRYSAAITSMGAWQQRLTAWKIRLYGFHQTKVKVGTEGVDDRSTLRRIRRIVGERMDLRVDANEAWFPDQLEAKLEPLTPFHLTAVEQPVPHEHVDRLADVRRRIAVPIMLDESLCSETDAHRAIDGGTCDLFNIRLSKCGGFLRSLRLAALAQQAGLGYQLGCQVGETGILSAAGRHFATSVAGIRYLEGSYDRHLVREPLTAEDLTFGPGGYAPALTGPGLGIDVDEQALRRVMVRQYEIPLSSPPVRTGERPT